LRGGHVDLVRSGSAAPEAFRTTTEEITTWGYCRDVAEE
jgi:hypothetical protein